MAIRTRQRDAAGGFSGPIVCSECGDRGEGNGMRCAPLVSVALPSMVQGEVSYEPERRPRLSRRSRRFAGGRAEQPFNNHAVALLAVELSGGPRLGLERGDPVLDALSVDAGDRRGVCETGEAQRGHYTFSDNRHFAPTGVDMPLALSDTPDIAIG